MTKLNRFDYIMQFIVMALLLYSVVILFRAYIDGEHLGSWIWGRHQNQFSWYSRPLFLIPACYYAYRRKPWMIFGFMVLLACSLFWFAAPQNVAEQISGYLEWEKQLFFSNESRTPFTLFTIAVGVFLFALFYAFWNRNPWIGLFIINTGTLAKIVVSVVIGGDAGMAAIVPSLFSLAIINCAAFVIRWHHASRPK